MSVDEIEFPTVAPLPWNGPSRCNYDVGDLILIAVRDKVVLAMLVQTLPTLAAFGDFQVVVPKNHGKLVDRRICLPTIAQFIGQSFASVDEATRVLRPHVSLEAR